MSGWRRVTMGLVPALVLLAVGTGAVLAKIPRSPVWVTAVLAGLTFVVALVSDPFKGQAARWLERPGWERRALSAHTRLHDHRGRLRRVRDCDDPLALGVHPAGEAEGEPPGGTLPAYVLRDRHPDVEQALRSGGMVILEGASTAGKSRLAYEVMRSCAANRRVVVPATPTSLRELMKAGVLLRNAIIWLDDVERHLVSGDLDGAILDALLPGNGTDVTLLATLRSEARQSLSAAMAESAITVTVDEVMRRARVIILDRTLTAGERMGAESLRADARIAAAIDQATGAGFAEYLAGAPAILDRWQSALRGENPTSGAIISAAVDARRAGHHAAIPRELLKTLHAHYLRPDQRYRPDLPTFEDGLAWACRPVKGARGCLSYAAEAAFHPFDYLVEHAQRATSLNDISEAVWAALLDGSPEFQLFYLAVNAHNADHRGLSIQAFRRLAEGGDAVALSNLGGVLLVNGDEEEAEAVLRRSAESGSVRGMRNLAIALAEGGRDDEAVAWLRRAAETGDEGAAKALGRVLFDARRLDEAESWLRVGAEDGDTGEMVRLGVLLHELGRVEEAEEWYRRAAEGGDVHAFANLGSLLMAGAPADAGHSPPRAAEARQWLTRTAETGLANTMVAFGGLHFRAENLGEVIRWWCRAMDEDDCQATDRGDGLFTAVRPDEAEAVWRNVAEGEPHVHYSLATLYHAIGQVEEARQWLRTASAGGVVEATRMLEELPATDPPRRMTKRVSRWLETVAFRVRCQNRKYRR